jgi:aminoglycoside phosphotransferase (APT) family kinase protein
VNQRATLYEGVVDALVALHGQEPPPEAELPHRTVIDELAWWTDYLAWSADGDEPVSLLSRALAWCAEHRPTTEPPATMLWGDVRLGNVVFTDDGAIAAVLDWEMATVGAPEHDLAWWWALEAMQDDLAGGRGAGFPPIAVLQARYEASSGRPLQDLAWFETFALLRSAAVLTRIGRLQQRAGVRLRMPLDDNPVLDHLARRIGVTT